MSDMNKSDEFFNLLESSSVLIDIIKVNIQLAEATCSATTLESSVNGPRLSPKSGDVCDNGEEQRYEHHGCQLKVNVRHLDFLANAI